jgi:hypothetical protein
VAYQKNFWRGESVRTNGREDKIRGNPEAPPMHHGPGEFDMSMGNGADSPKLGSSQPRVTGNRPNDELPLKSAGKNRRLHMVMQAQALRQHRLADDGTSTAAIGGGAGSAAGGGT